MRKFFLQRQTTVPQARPERNLSDPHSAQGSIEPNASGVVGIAIEATGDFYHKLLWHEHSISTSNQMIALSHPRLTYCPSVALSFYWEASGIIGFANRFVNLSAAMPLVRSTHALISTNSMYNKLPKRLFPHLLPLPTAVHRNLESTSAELKANSKRREAPVARAITQGRMCYFANCVLFS